MTGHEMRQQAALEHVAILQELDLGGHTLLLLSDGSLELIAKQEQAPDLTHMGLQLDRDETYRLFLSLHEQFKQQQDIRRND